MAEMITNDQLGTALHSAIRAVAEACRVTRRVQMAAEQTTRILKSDRSPVTVADFAAQAVIDHRITESFPGALLVGEESAELLREPGNALLCTAVVDAVRLVWEEATVEKVLETIDCGNHDATAGQYWTLDPVDGTKGFLRGEQYAVSLALINAGEVVLGVLGCPNLSSNHTVPFSNPDPQGLIYFATRGGGAWVTAANDPEAVPVRVKPEVVRDTKLRVCGSVESGHSDQSQTAQVMALLGGESDTARLDSQCKYAVVARAQADAYLRLPTRTDYAEKIWDHAAGVLIASEAGMTVTDATGAVLQFSRGRELSANSGIVCASPVFHTRIIEAIKRLA
ncbi:MAG: 3'(2'),5'-bisphosphate nucleotidase [Gammaproteobacteria bacterium]